MFSGVERETPSRRTALDETEERRAMEKFITERNETDGLVADALRTVRVGAAWGWEKLVEVFGGAAEAEVAAAVPQRIGGPSTLRDLGVPGSLAAEFEVYFDLMGLVKPDGRISRFAFRTADGVSHGLCTASPSAPARRNERAA
jgi:hypothetical protein